MIAPVPDKITRGTPAFWRTSLALFAAGLSTFGLLYSVQPLLPIFAGEFHVGAAESSLSLSLTTGFLAISMLVTGVIADSVGRRPLMVASMILAAGLVVLSAFVKNWYGYLALRALLGIAISGVPAIAMAYVSEEMHPKSTGIAMGIYIGSSAIGGMIGRLIASVLTDYFDWRTAVFFVGIFGLLCAQVFWRALPPSRHFRKRVFYFGKWREDVTAIFCDQAIPWLFVEGFLLLGCFVTVYNYIGFRLLAPPFSLSQTLVGFIFGIYSVGVLSSALMGDIGSRLGRRKVLWAAIVIALLGVFLTMFHQLVLIVIGIAAITFGFFGGHSIASSWVGNRSKTVKAQAASFYLLFYYLGSSVVGSAGGFIWAQFGWDGVGYSMLILLSLALVVSVRLIFVKPLPDTEADRHATQIVP